MLTLGQMTQTEFSRMSWTITLDVGQKMSKLDDPNYWANIALKLRPTHQIYVFSNDGTEYAEYVVLQCSRLYAKVGQVNYKNFDEVADNLEDEACEYHVVWKGPNRKFEVIRKADDSAVSSGHESREDGITSMHEYLKVLAA